MSVTTTATSVSYIYQEGEAYSLPYEYQNETDVKVSYIDGSGSKVILVYGIDYTVSGSSVVVSATLPAGVTITFTRQTKITQQTELPAQPITKAIEEAIDRNTMCIQEVAAAEQGLKLSFEETVSELDNRYNDFVEEIDEIVNHANVYIPAVDSAGNLSWDNEGGLPNPTTVNIKGPQGEQGLQGIPGRNGEQGIPGKDGINGKDGKDGEQGPPGVPGADGKDGEQGPQGIPGKDGRDGDQGPQGEPGIGIKYKDDVETYAQLPTAGNIVGDAYYVNEDGLLYIYGETGFPDNGDGIQYRGPQGPQGVPGVDGKDGEQGLQGIPGAPGTAATIAVGTVTTGAAVSSATVTNVGTSTAARFNFSIPRGDKGDPGEGSGDVRAAGNNTLTGINTFTATNTFDGIIRTKCDYQQSNVMMSSSMKSSLKADDNNVQSYILTLGNGIGVSYWDSSALLAGQVKTFIISVKRDFGGTGSFGIGVNHRIGNNVPTVYMVDGPLPDIAENECLKIAMEVDEPLNAVFIYILGKVAL